MRSLVGFWWGAIALLVLTSVALARARLLAGWKGNLTVFAPYAALIASIIIAFDAFLLQHWIDVCGPIVLLVNLIGFGGIALGVFSIWYRRCPKVSREKAERIALDYLKKSYPEEKDHRIEKEKKKLKGRSWYVTAQLTRKSGPFEGQVWSFEVVIDAKTGEVLF